MLVYILLAFIVGIFALIEDGKQTGLDKKLFNVGLFVFLLVVGLRYMHGDYGTYEMAYNERIDVGGDIGYYQLQLLLQDIGGSFQVFVFIITLISVFAFRQTFRMSVWPIFGIVMILGKIFTLYAMSGIRQYLAMAICWWAISELLIYKRKLLFLAMILIAYTLHGSAIIILPVYFFRDRRFNSLVAFLMILLAVIIGRSFMQFFKGAADLSDFVDNRFGSYVQGSLSGESGMNLLNYAENFLFLFLALLVRKKAVHKIPYFDFFLYMFLIYCGFLIAGNEVGIVKRLRDYYALSYAFIVPSFIYLFRDESLRKASHFIIVIYFIFLMFRSLTVYDSVFDESYYGKMIPYHSVFQMK